MSFDDRIENLVSTGKLSTAQAQEMRAAMGALQQAGGIESRRPVSANLIAAGLGVTLLLLLGGGFFVFIGSMGASSAAQAAQNVSETLNKAGATGQGNPLLTAYLFLVFFVFIPLLAILGISLLSWNSMAWLDEQTAASRAVLQAALQRRRDLLPNLFTAVRELMAFEKDVQSVSAEQKAFVGELEKAAAGGDESITDLRFFAPRLALLIKDHPDIKSARNVEILQQELASSENRIYAAREFYNGAARDYNAAIRRFPGFLIAGLAALRPRDYFLAEAAAPFDKQGATI